MEEKVLIKSERYGIRKIPIIFAAIGISWIIITIISTFYSIYKDWYDFEFDYYYDDYYDYYDYYTDPKHEHDEGCYMSEYEDDFDYDMANGGPVEDKLRCRLSDYNGASDYAAHFARKSALRFAFEKFSHRSKWYLYSIPAYFMLLLSPLTYFWLRSYRLTVTDKRIFGNAAFGKRVDLPMDSVSAISIIRIFKGISVSTASGKISFYVIKNANEIYGTISDLIVNRQNKDSKPEAVIKHETSNADEIKKFKDLLDSGVITQEEFDAKKKQLLGL